MKKLLETPFGTDDLKGCGIFGSLQHNLQEEFDNCSFWIYLSSSIFVRCLFEVIPEHFYGVKVWALNVPLQKILFLWFVLPYLWSLFCCFIQLLLSCWTVTLIWSWRRYTFVNLGIQQSLPEYRKNTATYYPLGGNTSHKALNLGLFANLTTPGKETNKPKETIQVIHFRWFSVFQQPWHNTV